MKLLCPSCGAQIRADDMNLDRMVAKCRDCHAVFDFVPEGRAASSRQRAAVTMPKSIRIDAMGPELTLSRRWFSAKFVFLIVFCAFWNLFLVFWYTMAFATDAPLLFKLFPLIHVSVGVGLTYFTACGLLNTTRVVVSGENLVVRHGPLPWPGARDVPTRDLAQLFTVEKVTQTKNGQSREYRVDARLRGGGDVKIVSGLPDVEQALFIEQQLEMHLGIRDEPVAGEVAR